MKKEEHYIPCTTDEKGITTETIAYLLPNNVWKLYSLSFSLSLDQGPQFISRLWKNLNKILGIKVHLSTIFHSKTDGQSKITNQEMERHLHILSIINKMTSQRNKQWLRMRLITINQLLLSCHFLFFYTN